MKKMFKITIYEDFFKQEMSGEFDSIDEAKEFYADELGTFIECIQIRSVELLSMKKPSGDSNICRLDRSKRSKSETKNEQE